MIRKLQKKFISITAGALFVMILLVLAAVNGTFFFQTNRQLNQRLDSMLGELLNRPGEEPLDSAKSPLSQPGEEPLDRPADELPLSPGSRKQEEPPSALRDTRRGGEPRFEDRLRIHTDGCVICLDEAGNILEIRQNAAQNYSQEELSSVADALLKKNRSRGWYQYFKYRIISRSGTEGDSWSDVDSGTDGDSGIVIGLLNASFDLNAVFTMLLISAVIGLVSFLLVLFIIILASGHAVKPIAESYARQKQFVTDAGHELKTPLTVISANSELARMIYGDSEWFDSIDRQVGKMNGLVRSLITLAKMDEEEKPVFSLFHLSDAVFDTAKSFEGLLHSRGRLLSLDIAENIRYNGDESRLRQVVSILMDNAVKYCDEKGKVTVKLFRDRQVRLQVINDFSDAENCELDKVFERFYRADRARTPDGSYGLGLSIAKSIVELHRGQIRAKALEHGRIMFEVTLPPT